MNSKIILGCLIILAVCWLQVSEAARGGSSRGSSSRSGRYSSSRYSNRRYSRSTGSSTYSSLSRFVSEGFSWSVKYRAYHYGFYLNSLAWRRSNQDLNSDTKICFNIQDTLPTEYNSSVQVAWVYQNRTTYGLFICPLDGSKDQIYCCGDDGAERCCGFWDDASRTTGIAVGIAFAAAGLILLCYVLYNCTKGCSAGSSSVSATTTTSTTSVGAAASLGGNSKAELFDGPPPDYDSFARDSTEFDYQKPPMVTEPEPV